MQISIFSGSGRLPGKIQNVFTIMEMKWICFPSLVFFRTHCLLPNREHHRETDVLKLIDMVLVRTYKNKSLLENKWETGKNK